MRAYKCDICGKFYPHNVDHEDRDYMISKWGQLVCTIEKYDYKQMDVCDECYNAFLDFVSSRSENKE